MLSKAVVNDLEDALGRWCSAYRDEVRYNRDLMALDARRAALAARCEQSRADQRAAQERVNATLATVTGDEDERAASDIVQRWVGEAEIASVVEPEEAGE